jgi:DtxR family transcriptional regulator, manganese transport regulator
LRHPFRCRFISDTFTEKYRGLILTATGKTLAPKIAHRRKLLTDLVRLLGLGKRVISHDVEGMEHQISRPALRAIDALAEQLQRRPAMVAKVGSALAWQNCFDLL